MTPRIPQVAGLRVPQRAARPQREPLFVSYAAPDVEEYLRRAAHESSGYPLTLFAVDGRLPAEEQVRAGLRRSQDERRKGTVYDHVWSVVESVAEPGAEDAFPTSGTRRIRVAYLGASFENWVARHSQCEREPGGEPSCAGGGESGLHEVMRVIARHWTAR